MFGNQKASTVSRLSENMVTDNEGDLCTKTDQSSSDSLSDFDSNTLSCTFFVHDKYMIICT